MHAALKKLFVNCKFTSAGILEAQIIDGIKEKKTLNRYFGTDMWLLIDVVNNAQTAKVVNNFSEKPFDGTRLVKVNKVIITTQRGKVIIKNMIITVTVDLILIDGARV